MGKQKKLNVQRSHLLKFVLLARYRTLSPSPKHLAYASYSSIGKTVGLSSTTVRKLCLKCVNKRIDLEELPRKVSKRIQSKQIGLRKYFGVLTKEHYEFLTSQSTLKKQVGLTLTERAALFHQSYPLVKITKG